MPIKVKIPGPLQKLTQDKSEVEVEASSIKELVVSLEKSYPGIKDRICDENGKIRRFINFYVNDEDVRFLKGDDTSLKADDQVSIVPAIAGGGSIR